MTPSYDVIVLGVGSMGSASCYYLANRGYKVLGLEQFDIPHDQGSHAGQTRIIRKAYFEHPDYVPLLERAYANWQDLEDKTQSQVYFRTGLYYAGQPESVLIKGVKESARKYNLMVESILPEEHQRRFHQFTVPPGYEVRHEPDAGFITPERAVLLYVDEAIKAGATIQTREKVIHWKREHSLIHVETSKGTYKSQKTGGLCRTLGGICLTRFKPMAYGYPAGNCVDDTATQGSI